MLASASLFGCVERVRADSPVEEISIAPIPAERAGNDVELMAPTNSTLEIRIARRPWLLERLTKPSPAPSIKMNPPNPPREIIQPPSANQIVPKSQVVPNSEGDSWVARDGDTGTLFHDDHLPPSDEANAIESQGTTAGGTAFADVTMSRPDAGESPAEGSQSEEDGANPGSTVTAPLMDGATPADDQEPMPLVDPQEAAGSSDGENENLDWGPNHDRSPNRDRGQEVDQVEAPQDSAREQFESIAAEDNDVAEEAVVDDHASLDSSEANDAETSADQEVTVRKLRINRDGTPASVSDEDQVVEEEGEDEVSRYRDGASIGDLDEEVDVDDQTEAPPIANGSRANGSRVESSESPEAELDYTGYPRTPIRLTSSVYRMQGMMRQCLRYYYARPENANERSNWGMLHSIMVYGADTKIIAGNKTYSAIAWIAGNNACRGQKLIEERDGRIAARSGIGLQGHQGQMLAIFALCDVPSDYPLYAGDRRYTVKDLVREEMLACRTGEELTFTLIGLAHYLDTEAVWENESGEIWNFQRLLREELAQPIVGAACGGTHRLMGYAHALRKRRAEGRSISGQWKRADVYLQDFVRYVYRLQNRDGSMSTDWFEGREDNEDLDRKIQTTGHMVEWLLTVTPDSQLQDQRLVNAVRFLLSSMYNERTQDWKVGPKGHALRSLAMYYERVYQQGPAWRSTGVATGQSSQRR